MRAVTLGVSALTLLASGQVYAADLYRVPDAGSYKDSPAVAEMSWSGFYAGVNGGYGWSAKDNMLSGLAVYWESNPNCAPRCPVLHETGAMAVRAEGGFGGGQLGYNLQRGMFVFGAEADIQGAGIDGSGVLSFPHGASASGKNELDWFGTVRGRAGLTFDRTLLYFTGGFAFGGVKDVLNVTPAHGTPSTAGSSETKAGYVLGGGVEHLLNPSWSVKVEYQYIDLGSDKLSTTAAANSINEATATLDAEHAYHTVRLGLNYHLHEDLAPLK